MSIRVSYFGDCENVLQYHACSLTRMSHDLGYGFLSESAKFAQSLVDNSITWVGPPPSILELFGDKIQARALAEKSNVPVVKGSGNLSNGDEVMAILEDGKVGLPAIMKVSSRYVVHEPGCAL